MLCFNEASRASVMPPNTREVGSWLGPGSTWKGEEEEEQMWVAGARG